MIKKLLFTLLAAVAVSSAAAEVKFNSVDPAKLIEMGKSEGKLIFVDIYATWCPPCKMMEKDVFSRTDVGDYMSSHFVCGKYNIDESMGGALAKRHNVRSIPTYLILNGAGELIARLQGAMSSAEFIESMESIRE